MPSPYYVMLHSPGEAWRPGVRFNEQPDVDVDVTFLRGMLSDGRLALGGRFLDDSGGMAVVRAASLADAEAWAHDDESVRNGLWRSPHGRW